MADFYATEFAGLKDGTQIPRGRAEGWTVGYRPRGIRATKPVGQALAVGDRLYIGRRRAGETILAIAANAGLSLGTTTISVGPTGTPAKYVNAKTLTVVDVPTMIGPDCGSSENDPGNAYEDLWATIGVAGIAGGTNVVFDLLIRGVN